MEEKNKPNAYLIVCAHTGIPGFNEKRTDGKSGTDQGGLPEEISSCCHMVYTDLSIRDISGILLQSQIIYRNVFRYT